MTPDEMLREFHRGKNVHGGWMPERPVPPASVPGWIRDIRRALLAEEVAEFRAAALAGDITAVADALGDITYVLGGTAVVHGVPFRPWLPASPAAPSAAVPDRIRDMAVSRTGSIPRRMRDADITVNAAAALASCLHTTGNVAMLYGVPLDAVLAEIHRSNMTKTNSDGLKLAKGPGYSPPDIAGILGLPPEGVQNGCPECGGPAVSSPGAADGPLTALACPGGHQWIARTWSTA
jgi:predicted HAD superfamily Cof-like phosphohydrolase